MLDSPISTPLSSSLSHRPSLLVSVRNRQEALGALEGGAAVIDVKEPTRGPLGRADSGVVAEVARAVGAQRLVTAAAGDWGELPPDRLVEWARDSGAAVVKVGLPAGIPTAEVQDEIGRTTRLFPPGVSLAPVLYADLLCDKAPSPDEVVQLLGAGNAEWLVVDTFDKTQGDLLDAWPEERVEQLIAGLRQSPAGVVLAGSLRCERLDRAARLGPTLVGVRGAVCGGGRSGALDGRSVKALVGRLAQLGQKKLD